MVRPGYSETTDVGVRQVESRRAVEIVGRIVEGRPVSQEAATGAGAALVDVLWRGQGADLPVAQEALAFLIPSIGDVESQAQLLGEVVAIGVEGTAVFDKLAESAGNAASVAGLDPAETRSLRDSLKRSPRERLAMVADLLQTEGPDRRPSPSRNDRPLDAVVDRRRLTAEDAVAQDSRPPGPAPDGHRASHAGERRDDDPESMLRDPSADPALRVQAAVTLGALAIEPLARMLRGGDGDRRELAFVALTELGAVSGLDRLVHDRMKVLEAEPDTRPVAEHIRRNIESGGARSGNPGRLADETKVGDGWLGRAIAACDRPGILRAAAGREGYAIPLALRRLASLRSRRTAEHS